MNGTNPLIRPAGPQLVKDTAKPRASIHPACLTAHLARNLAVPDVPPECRVSPARLQRPSPAATQIRVARLSHAGLLSRLAAPGP